MGNNIHTRRRLLQTVGVAVGSSIAVGTVSADDEPWTFSASLSGDAASQPVETNASGQALFEADPDGETVDYQLHVDHLCDATQAHVHLGAADEDGPVVAWLYPESGKEPSVIEGRFDGVLAEGTLTADDLVGPLEGEDVETVAEILVEEGAYVNVHTEENPEGEIRGQIVPERIPSDTPAGAEPDEAPPADEPEEEPGEPDADEPEESPEGEEPEETPEDEPEADEPEEPPEEAVDSAADARGVLEVTGMQVEGSDAEAEWIEFTNAGDVPLDMSDWTVRDRYDHGVVDGRGFSPARFPGGFTLEPGRSFRLVTAPGESTDERVHWGYDQHVWNEAGDVIIVLDGNGQAVLEYEYGDPPSSLGLLLSRLGSLFG